MDELQSSSQCPRLSNQSPGIGEFRLDGWKDGWMGILATGPDELLVMTVGPGTVPRVPPYCFIFVSTFYSLSWQSNFLTD